MAGDFIGIKRDPRIVHIGSLRGAKLTDAAIKVASERGLVMSASAVAKYLIDNYTDDAVSVLSGKKLASAKKV